MLEIIVLTLIVIVAFIATSWYAHQRSQERAKAFERELEIDESREDDSFQQRFDALFEQELHEDDDSSAEKDKHRLSDTADREPDLFDEPPPTMDESGSATQVDETPEDKPDWEMVVAFTIMAPEGRAFTGRAVKAALEKHDLHFGDMQIFHKHVAGSRKQILFSVANILDPGTLLPDKFVSMTTPGLLIFTRLPGPVNGLALFDDLLDTARGINDQLGGILCDESRQPVSDEALEATRSKILNYQMSAQAESDQFSNDYFN
ncbi:cell division protein ZipA C-terminal FtsZ-binding domain-containing protein [Methylophaga sp.]|uniref:cell division protein ZipA C-terminal FtsZ-binding domain-containing protein n=1 Tax=Methylophaga sp. TaxID=2024840 RepID=UPI0013FEAD32|nr:cell division protein ZipA C-terminal FtsZ-binding domain-containing protein [Methylophaga sp.]MTI63808.1 cell division protein ZipA [Methylophaga sp.]